MTDLMGMADLAKMLVVSRQQVFTWYKRCASNGFPEPKTSAIVNKYRYQKGQWDPEEVRAWRAQYVPSKGGRPSRAG